MLSIKITRLHWDKEILKGINLEVKAGEIPCDNGTKRCRKKYACVKSGNENYEVTEGEIILEGEDLRELALKKEREYSFVSLSGRNPGVSVTNFIRSAINETRKANGEEEMPANQMLKECENYWNR
jgi:Fe-S cluster assembly ATP-binding protein